MPTRFILILAAVSMFVIACSTPKLTPDPNMKYFHEITEGEELDIQWKFKNAHRVKIEGFEGSYLPEGSITVKPETSREYKLTAFKGFTDSLVWTVYVDVLAKISPDEVRTGDIVLEEQFGMPSYEESEFLNGIIDEKNSTGPDELRIVRVKKDDNTGVASVHALLLDKLGNFVSGYGYKKDSVIWNSTNTCGEISANYSRLDFNELSANKNKEYVDFAILIDNSVFSNNDSIKEPLRDFIKGMNQNDNVMLSFFNNKYINVMGLMSPELALHEYDNTVVLSKKSGFNGSIEAVSHAVDAIESGKNKNRAVVLVTYSNDNATFGQTIEHLAKKAEMSNVAVYVIGIGDIIDSREFRYLSAVTGGKYYLLLNDEIEKFGTVMSEILFTYRNSYQIVVPARRLNNKCELTKSHLSFSDQKRNLSSFVYYPVESGFSNQRTVLTAGFDEVSLTIGSEYYEYLNRIAKQLNSSDNNYYITGYSYDEGNDEVSTNFSLLRAEAVKDYLVVRGVKPSKLIVKTELPDFAMFRNTSESGLLKLNRRVELTEYYEEEQMKYELTCGLFDTETEAVNSVQEWEKRGYNAYYLRKSNGYSVILWNFKNKADAEKTASDIKRKYKQESTIN